MTDNELDYYLAFPVMAPGTPAVIVSPDWDSEENLAVQIRKPLTDFGQLPVEFEFNEPYPKSPNMVDCFSNGVNVVISEKLHAVLEPLKIEGLQLIPATIADPRNHTVYDKYYFPHIFNYIECLDRDKSVYTKKAIGTIRMIQKMTLDTNVLSKTALKNRLIFRLGEFYTFLLFHKSVVDKMMATNPTGIRFVRVEDYHTGSAFD
jgi:hypothetical protein